MDPSGPVTLPKGILTNTSTVYDEVAGYSILPADKVRQYWHVYTTTNKKLKDPTARRLENFWWHVWGSDRSKLSGRVLARIFQDISLGPTVVPLRGPPNRWEGSDAAPLTIEMIMAHLRRNILVDSGNELVSITKVDDKSASVTSSGAPRPSPPPPILKKVGISATNITRNTARFISPHESAEEDSDESNIPSSSCTLANSFHPSRHTVVNIQADVQGNAMFQKSQAPTAKSEPASTASTIRRQPFRDRASKTPARQEGSGDRPNTCSRGTGRPRLNKTAFANGLAQDNYEDALIPSNGEETALDEQKMIYRSQSSTTPDRTRELPKAKRHRSLFTAATSSTTTVAAQGTIIDQSGSVTDLPQLSTSRFHADETSSREGSSTSTLLEARLAPTRPSSSTVLPLGRTKSQLTLLLEREKERSRS